MLYELFFPLHDKFIGFNLLQYQTFRTAMAALTAFLLALFWGPRFIQWLRNHQFQERPDKSDAPELAELWKTAKKGETPTMGGLLFGFTLLAAVFLWGRLDNLYVLLGIALYLSFGLVGFFDDYIKLRHTKHFGLSRRAKMLWLSTSAILVLLVLFYHWNEPQHEYLLRIYVPFFKRAYLDLPAWGLVGVIFFFVFEWLVLVGFSNATNITDGMDGLATGCALMVAIAFLAICYVVGKEGLANYLFIPWVPGCEELAVFAGALVGACLGFLWFNCYPAQIFLGDTGALPIGGILGYFAIIAKQEFVLPVVGGIFLLEVTSSYVQIFVYKGWKVRPFRMAPLHHVFQLDKIPETKIVVRFWLIGAILAIASLAILKLR